MKTLGKYLTNASFNNINVNKAFDKLIKEFENKNITYPRTDGIHHEEIKILNKKNINKEVERLIELDIEKEYKKKYNEVNDNTIYYIAEQLNLSTPASLIDDVKKSKYVKKTLHINDIRKNFKKFKINKKLDKYLNLNECSLDDIIKIKNKKLNKNKFNKELDKLR